MLTASSAFALFSLLALSSLVFYVSKRLVLPYTVLLVFAGVLLVPLSRVPGLGFIDNFTLTPELLFYIFLPTLIFESAYNMNIRRVVDELKPVLLLAVVGYLASAFLIGGGMWLIFSTLGFPIPFSITLLFGALISATDPVAVLALFKEYGAPRRLSLIFEGESLLNDATALAFFLVVLGLVEKGFSSGGFFLGGITFTLMLLGGALFGLVFGGAFARLIRVFRENELVSVTLMIVLAHLTFLSAEITSEAIRSVGIEFIRFSPIIATTVASLVMGNYGRYALSPRAEEFVEKFWSQFAFMANSIVFILVGLLFASIPKGASALFIPTVAAVLVVAISRALSVYGTLIPFNLLRKKEKKIPMAWQHVLAWGSLRGALAVMLVLLVPESLTVPYWPFPFSVREFLLVITISNIFVTLFIKAPAIGPIMRRLHIDDLTELETVEYREAQALVHGTSILKIHHFAEKGYLPKTVAERLSLAHEEKFKNACEFLTKGIVTEKTDFAERALRLYLIGMEKQTLKTLFTFDEITERIFKRVLGKLTIQSEEVERGNLDHNSSKIYDSRDVFENMSEYMRTLLMHDTDEDTAEARYLYYRAQAIIANKALKELARLEREFTSSIFNETVLARAQALYTRYRNEAMEKGMALAGKNPDLVGKLDAALASRSVFRVEEKVLVDLKQRELITPKLYIKLREEYEKETMPQRISRGIAAAEKKRNKKAGISKLKSS